MLFLPLVPIMPACPHRHWLALLKEEAPATFQTGFLPGGMGGGGCLAVPAADGRGAMGREEPQVAGLEPTCLAVLRGRAARGSAGQATELWHSPREVRSPPCALDKASCVLLPPSALPHSPTALLLLKVFPGRCAGCGWTASSADMVRGCVCVLVLQRRSEAGTETTSGSWCG